MFTNYAFLGLFFSPHYWFYQWKLVYLSMRLNRNRLCSCIVKFEMPFMTHFHNFRQNKGVIAKCLQNLVQDFQWLISRKPSSQILHFFKFFFIYEYIINSQACYFEILKQCSEPSSGSFSILSYKHRKITYVFFNNKFMSTWDTNMITKSLLEVTSYR